ncbi:MAG: hypothetical protein JWP59_4009 [Massilia sp.]|nr:hypothetical protein [Massilia sp.]
MSIHTLTHLSTRWPNFDLGAINVTQIRRRGTQKVSSSRGGAGMIFLEGIEVAVNGAWLAAHLSFPPDGGGTGTFSEGHLKIESGDLLNQYFFSCDDNDTWEVEKLTNSKSVPTKKPGKWERLPTQLWSDIETLAAMLAYL